MNEWDDRWMNEMIDEWMKWYIWRNEMIYEWMKCFNGWKDGWLEGWEWKHKLFKVNFNHLYGAGSATSTHT